MKADLLYEEFAPAGVPATIGLAVGGPLLLEPGGALALINRAADEGVPILRVDGVCVAAGGTESSPEHVADFSAAVAEGHGCWADAEAFVSARRGRGLVFAIALGDDPVEAV